MFCRCLSRVRVITFFLNKITRVATLILSICWTRRASNTPSPHCSPSQPGTSPLPVSHLFPVNPCWQTQLLGERQVPPFWHNPSHIAEGRPEEKSHYSLRLTSVNYVIRAAAYVFAYRIRANLVNMIHYRLM